MALDAHAGRPSLLTKKEADIVTDLVIRHDRGNNGVNKKEIAEKIVAMKPSLSMKQAGDAFHRTVHPENRTLVLRTEREMPGAGQTGDASGKVKSKVLDWT